MRTLMPHITGCDKMVPFREKEPFLTSAEGGTWPGRSHLIGQVTVHLTKRERKKEGRMERKGGGKGKKAGGGEGGNELTQKET